MKTKILTLYLLGLVTSAYSQVQFTIYDNNGAFDGNTIKAIVIDDNNNIWCGTEDDGIFVFDRSNWIQHYTTNNGLADNDVRDIKIDDNGNFWVATGGSGVSKFNGNTWVTYTTSNGLVNNNVNAIEIDNQGNLWFATNRGISKFDGNNWTTYDTSNTNHGLSSLLVHGTFKDSQGNLWFGTNTGAGGSGGATKFDGTNWTAYNPAPYFNCFAEDDNGNIWAGGGALTGFIYKFDGNNWTSVRSSGCGAIVNALEFDSQGNLWAVSYGGAHKYDGTNWTEFNPTDVQGWAYGSQHAIAIDSNDDVWMGSRQVNSSEPGGLIYLENSNSTSIQNFNVQDDNTLKVYPNPTTGLINMSLNYSTIDNLKMELVTSTGERCYYPDLYHQSNIVLNEKGIYFLRLKGNNIDIIKKIIVQ